jgi:hypothetical protein
LTWWAEAAKVQRRESSRHMKDALIQSVVEADRDMLDIAQDPFMANVYRTALIVALEEFFGRVQIFGDDLTLAKYGAKEWPNPELNQMVADMVRRRGLN